MQSKAKTVAEYLSELPDERRAAIEQLREVFRKNLDKRVVEGMNYGMIGYSVPHSVYPPGYHCDPKQPLPFASIASQKNHLAIYLFCLYTDAAEQAEFERAWKATGKKLDMGKSCVRFKRIDDVPLDVVAAALEKMTVKKFIGAYETAITTQWRKKTAGKKAAAKKTAKK